jgi:hypothetical protein
LRVRLKNAYEVVRFLDQSQFNGVDGIAGVRAKLETAMEDAATAIKLHIADPDTKHPVEKGQSNLSNMSDQRLTARVRELVLHPGATLDDPATREAIGGVLERLEIYSAMFRGASDAPAWFDRVPNVAKKLADRGKQLGEHPDGRLMAKGASMLKSLIRAHYDRQSSPDRS